jgi:phage/plasmid-associated DNA primase
MDALGQWLEECCEGDHTSIVPVSDLYANYQLWSSQNHGYTMKAARFGRELSERGFESDRQGKARKRRIKGLRLAQWGFEEPGGGQ